MKITICALIQLMFCNVQLLGFVIPYRRITTKMTHLRSNDPNTDQADEQEMETEANHNGLDASVVSSFSDETTVLTEQESLKTVAVNINGDHPIVENLDDANQVTTKLDQSTLTTQSTDSNMLWLLNIAASTGRGEFATQDQKELAMTFIAALENMNPTPEPTKSIDILGTWELVYSNTQLFRSSPFFMAGRATCRTAEEAQQYDWFCDMHRSALAISQIGAVRQVISSHRLVSEFEVKVGAVPFLHNLTPFSYSGGLPITMDGAICSSADITPTEDGTAFDVLMDTVDIKGSNIPGLRQILDNGFLSFKSRNVATFLEETSSRLESIMGVAVNYKTPRPVFSTTYLSPLLRISRDPDGKVFVYTKVSKRTEPTDYSSTMSDMGLAKLLEGINDTFLKYYI